MEINNHNLNSLYTGYSSLFKDAFAGVNPLWSRVATFVPSATASNEYGWLGQLPGFREWIGDRQIKAVEAHGYTLVNRHFENTVSVKRNAIEDDQYGVYSPLFSELGRSAAVFPDTLVFELLAAGFATACYDGQYFFDGDHPVLDAAGNPTTVSNTGGGGGTPWFLLDTTRALKPLIYQQRKSFDRLVRKDRETDDNVFDKNEYVYGSDGRCQVGFGFWQMAYGSKQTLDASAYATARAAMAAFKGDGGRPLGIMPNLLVVPPSLEAAALAILAAERGAAGATNVWNKTAEVLVVPWLA